MHIVQARDKPAEANTRYLFVNVTFWHLRRPLAPQQANALLVSSSALASDGRLSEALRTEPGEFASVRMKQC